ncbi:MAG TPA: TlpA disulfide reductase family protein [Cyclobacteriaceae bacterium]|nr:TlpA disulfide reductase family protein [Cyclobacteriaceae bacterium]
MKKRTTLFLLMACISMVSYGKVVIRGKIRNYDGKSLVYYHSTIEGIYTPYGILIQPLPNGTFRIEFENQGLGNVKVNYKMLLYRFFHDENSQIYFEFNDQGIDWPKRVNGEKVFTTADSLKKLVTLKISGDYEQINQFYNRNLRSSYSITQQVDGNYYSKQVFKTTSPTLALSVLDSLSQLELDQINRLPWQVNTENLVIQKKEEAVRAMLTNEVYAFYGAIFLNAMFLKRKEQISSDSSANLNVYNRDWELLIEKLADEMKSKIKPLPNSPDYNDFVESMAYAITAYRQYYFPQNPNPLDEMLMDRLFKYDTILISDKKARFAYELSGLQRFLNDQSFYSPALLHAVYDLQKKYPNSVNMDFYKPQIEKLRANLETAQREFKGGKIINSNYNSLNDLLKHFEGKNVLIDIWATWCHPCIEDFKYKSSIQPYRDSLELEMLYISIDKPEWDDRWRQSIKINQLEGYHFRANNKFIIDMWSTIGDWQGAIPRYVLIDKKGNIFKSTAARPSMGKELSSQITELISKLE